MNSNPKSTNEASPETPAAANGGREASPVTAFATLAIKGIERFAQAQKSALDMLVEQNAETHQACKQVACKLPGAAPALILMDFAALTVEKFVDAQKSLLDLAVGQSAVVVNAAKERVDSASNFAKALPEVVHRSTEQVVAAQKLVLDLAAQQNAAMTDRFKRQFGLSEDTPAAVAADSIRRGVDVVLDAQKELLDIAAKPIQAATARAAAAVRD